MCIVTARTVVMGTAREGENDDQQRKNGQVRRATDRMHRAQNARQQALPCEAIDETRAHDVVEQAGIFFMLVMLVRILTKDYLLQMPEIPEF